ncbi:outer membrane beta-barrel protein [Devosia sp.]|uniref:outer membrane beta-barrel protein n=1 Tax=Devosia sp. TaxID=1871048 RepID=UPI001B2940DB|nr:outer membrane beta-barrel protein [Devosia sp.]MBO9590077.1 outer membrane beta-barrel protein [Devosia sp.]
MGLVAGLMAGTAFAAPALLATEPVDETTTGGIAAPRPQTASDPTLSNARLRPGVYPAQPVPPEFAIGPETSETAPLDWSVGLRGTYLNSNGTGSFVTHFLPRFTYTHAGGIATIVVDGSADIAKTGGQDLPTLASGSLTISGSAPIDSVTTASVSANIGLSQDLPGTAGLSPSIITPPQIFTGGAEFGVTRQFGKFNVGVGAGIDRTVYGPTDRTDTGLTDNAEQNYWAASANLRLGYQITPIFEVFGEGEVQRDIFDVPTASLGTYPNATNRSLRAGIAGKWNNIWSASASVGIGERVFDEATLGAIRAQLYGAEVSYTPDSTVKLTAGLETALAPAGADNPGNARIQYTAFTNAQYTVNTWLRLRASANWSNSELVGTGTTERRLGLGAGADYVFNAHTSLNADYGYGNTDNSNGNTQTHQVSLGVTIAR